ncbi:MAG: hypothetical protein ACE5G1_02660 [bacterium]
MQRTLITLAELSYHLGLIGIDELHERIEVAFWLADDGNKKPDPRATDSEEVDEEGSPSASEIISTINDKPDQKDWIKFLFDGKWVFTKSDPDSYPSVPHGHLKKPNQSWPKLNPYTGRAYRAKHQEDCSLRLSRLLMKKLWTDQKFRSFCRDFILWCMEEYPYYKFPVANPLPFEELNLAS